MLTQTFLNHSNIESILTFYISYAKKEDLDYIFENIDDTFFTSPLFQKLFKYQKECFLTSQNMQIERFLIENSVNVENMRRFFSQQIAYDLQTIVDFFKTTHKNNIFAKIARITTDTKTPFPEKEEKLKLLYQQLERTSTVHKPRNSSEHVLSDYSDYIKKNAEKYLSCDGSLGISTRISDLDKMIKGVKNRDYIIIAARPSMGKTSLSLNPFIEAIKAGQNPVYLSVEMPKEQMLARMISIEKQIPLEETLYGAAGYDKMMRIAKEAFGNKNFWIEDFSDPSSTSGFGVTISDCDRVLNRIANKHKIGLIVVDFMQLISDENPRLIDQNQIMANVSIGLKRFTGKYDCPLIALSQLNRSLESRIDKRPIMSDLRSSGAIEQDADIIGFLYRPEVYLERELKSLIEEGKGDTAFYAKRLENIKNSKTTRAEIIVAKNRNGPTGTAYAQFVRAAATYEERKDGDFDKKINEAFGPINGE